MKIEKSKFVFKFNDIVSFEGIHIIITTPYFYTNLRVYEYL